MKLPQPLPRMKATMTNVTFTNPRGSIHSQSGGLREQENPCCLLFVSRLPAHTPNPSSPARRLLRRPHPGLPPRNRNRWPRKSREKNEGANQSRMRPKQPPGASCPLVSPRVLPPGNGPAQAAHLSPFLFYPGSPGRVASQSLSTSETVALPSRPSSQNR